MKRSIRALGALATIAMAASSFAPQAQAALVLSVVLTPATDVSAGGALSADIFVSGLTGAVGGYNFDLNYDAGRMDFASFVADPDNLMGDLANPALDLSGGDSGGSVNINMLAGFFLPADEATLAGLQGPGFRLGHVEFTALNNSGFASFTLSGVSFSNYDGSAALQVDAASGARVCVSPAGAVIPCDNNNVPEPMGALLALLGLGGLAATRRTRKAA